MTAGFGRDSVPITEVFATVQGEGPTLGRRASFIRFGGCDLACSWCDSAHTWDARRFDLRREITRTLVDDVAATVLAHRTPTVVLTGGEPLLHQDHPGWRGLVARLDEAGKRLEVETNGTRIPGDLALARIAQFNVSPKLANSGMPAARRIVPAALAALAADGRAHFKFVCTNPADVDEVAVMVAAHGLPTDRVWIMPEGTTADQVLDRARALVPRVMEHGYNLTTRLHILLWGDERGR